MIDHDIANRVAAERIVAITHPSCSPAKPHVANHDVMCINFHRVARDANAVAWCRATVNR